MSLAVVYSRASLGIAAPQVTVEVHLSNGLPAFNMVGLPETSVKESRDRVRSALLNGNFEFPSKHITVNLAPADLPKEGGRYDLAIALGILAASAQIPTEKLSAFEWLGELTLSGEIHRVQGIIPAVIAARDAGRAMLLPKANEAEAALCRCPCYSSQHLLALCARLNQGQELQPVQNMLPPESPAILHDLCEVRGQQQARRALEIAAAGGHNLLMNGPPGTGKTLLASCLPGILPRLAEQEALEVAAIYSVAQPGNPLPWSSRPFRAPHHTASGVALVGGGSQPKPGEITLAHHGVLFLDELPEYSRKVLDVLREPLETGAIVIARAAQSVNYPARFQLVAAMNPCPCGYIKEPKKRCADCSESKAKRYQASISGPLLDRIDLQIEVPPLPKGILTDQQSPTGESSAVVQARVQRAFQLQIERQGCRNASLSNAQLREVCALTPELSQLLESAIERIGLSARAYHRVLKVARSIADLAGETQLQKSHLLEALSYRQLERNLASGA